MSKERNAFGLRDYLLGRRLWIATYGLTCILFGLVFVAFQLPIQPILYGYVLTFSCGILLGAVGYWRTKARVSVIQRFFDLPSRLEDIEVNDPIEGVYATGIRRLMAQWADRESQEALKLSRLEDYYTLWAHQIKTPIAATYMLLEDGESSRVALKNEVFKIEEYVDMLLGYLRLDASSTDYLFKKVALDQVLRRSVRRYAPQFIQKKIALNYGDVPVTVLTDEKWFAFLFEQLLSNAVKYTRKGTIAVHWREEGLAIVDTGIGIPKEDLPRVFEMGYTGFNGRLDQKSTGIGLALCQRIAHALSLEIVITSQVGEGTEVLLTFPKEQIQ